MRWVLYLLANGAGELKAPRPVRLGFVPWVRDELAEWRIPSTLPVALQDLPVKRGNEWTTYGQVAWGVWWAKVLILGGVTALYLFLWTK